MSYSRGAVKRSRWRREFPLVASLRSFESHTGKVRAGGRLRMEVLGLLTAAINLVSAVVLWRAAKRNRRGRR